VRTLTADQQTKTALVRRSTGQHVPPRTTDRGDDFDRLDDCVAVDPISEQSAEQRSDRLEQDSLDNFHAQSVYSAIGL